MAYINSQRREKIANLFINSTIAFAVLIFLVNCDNSEVASPTLYGLAGCGANAEGMLYTIDTSDATGTPVGSGVGFERCGGLAIDSNGTLFATCERMDGTNDSVLITIDLNTGVGSEIGPFMCPDTNAEFTDFTVRNTDDMLMAVLFQTGGDPCINTRGLHSINKATGEASAVVQLIGDDGCCGFGFAYSSVKPPIIGPPLELGFCKVFF